MLIASVSQQELWQQPGLHLRLTLVKSHTRKLEKVIWCHKLCSPYLLYAHQHGGCVAISWQEIGLMFSLHRSVTANNIEAFLQDQVHLLMHCSPSMCRDGEAPIHTHLNKFESNFKNTGGEFQHLHGQIPTCT